MAREVVEKCDCCGRVVSDVLRDREHTSLRHHGAGYRTLKRTVWSFGPWPRFWHREPREPEIICDWCWDVLLEDVEKRLLGEVPEAVA